MYQVIVGEFKKRENPRRAKEMAAYMRNQFLFYGIKTPERREIIAPILMEMSKQKDVDWNFVFSCWEDPRRELQYVALTYLNRIRARLTIDDIDRLKRLAVTKSWWDTVDSLDTIIGDIAFRDRRVDEILLSWSRDDNIWLRRIAINHQRKRKDKTDTALLEEIIRNNLGSDEFFINKAIGWSLREYSKTNPVWVRDFLDRYRGRLARLSVREGSKYI
ncbi:MAG: DNA alkylation repair protein [Bacilli bacterium]